MSSGLQAIRLIVVDDNPHMRAIVLAMLRGTGLSQVRQARDGGQAFAMLRQEPADVALVDFLMAPVDGVHFTREVRLSKDSPDVFLPVIMMTGHSERSRVEEARDAGVTEFMIKPLTLRTLVDRLEAVIDRPRPFVRTLTYFGPDRRRRDNPRYAGPRRRAADRGEAAPGSVVEI